ncbi:hypothetical protein [Flavobacterium suzhouense]|uniref:Uncharacterized protein n=1 Tax=Flavobacterium suzhouense TaxID=1529638 RepID=A0ABW5NPS0_9FLAO
MKEKVFSGFFTTLLPNHEKSAKQAAISVGDLKNQRQTGDFDTDFTLIYQSYI